MPVYAELRCRTSSSFLRGASHPSELMERAAELGLSALGIVDRDGVYGMPKAYRASKEHPGVKLIVGAELTLKGRPPLALLARDRAAYGVLCRLITASHAGKPKGEAALEWQELADHLALPGARGLLALLEDAPGVEHQALKELFEDRAYLTLSRLMDGRDGPRTERALELSHRCGLPLVATNDVHYHVPERRLLQDVLTALREGTTLPKAGKRLFSNSERFLKSPEEMAFLFRDLPEAIRNTLVIAEQCTFSPAELRYRYPSEWIPAGETAQSYLERLTWEGAARRYPEGTPPDVKRQLEHELRLIGELSFADYFLTIWEIVEFARSKGILCQGRGSAANSAVCFCLGITAVDPVRMNLLFERFISAERGEPPDIDVDFEHERREEVIQHVYEKYGRHRAGMVAAVITYRSRLASREVCKVLEVPLEEVRKKRRARGVADHSEPEWVETEPERERRDEDRAGESSRAERGGAPGAGALAARLSEELQGFPRHLSIHSGGFTLSADPLIETVPIEPARMEGRTIVQWDKDDLDAIGLLKVDLLSLGMLSAIRKTLELTGIRDLARIPPEDPPTYAMIRRADTVGTFQIESRAQMSMLPRLLPRTFYDLVIQVAIVRPGPIQGGMVHPFLKRRRGEEPAAMPDPRLEPILGKTLGVPLFQEQVMKMAIVMAGFTPGEADRLRRAIGAWRSSGEIAKLGHQLMDGLVASGLSREYAERIFKQIQGFAEYGFPESHAASFALLAYASAYLKCHHPAEFTCSLINSQPMGFYPTHALVDDAKRHGVRVLPLDPNVSRWDCEIVAPNTMRLGWRVVKGLGEDAAKSLVAERERRPFAGLADFLARSALKRGVLHALALGDAFAPFGIAPREALWEILAYELASRPEATGGGGLQLNLFSEAAIAPSSSRFREMSAYEAIRTDYSVYGLSVRGHPMRALRERIPDLPPATTGRVRSMPSGRSASVAGLVIVRQMPSTAKGVCFATLEDEDGFLDLILYSDVLERHEELFWTDSFLTVRGEVQRDGNAVSMKVRRIDRLVSEPV